MSDFGCRAPSGFIAAFLVAGWFAGIVLAASAAIGGGGSGWVGSGAAGWVDCFSRDALQLAENFVTGSRRTALRSNFGGQQVT